MPSTPSPGAGPLSQFRLEVGGDEFFIDLLFYHTRLKCYVVIELKGTAFKPEHVGQLNFYLSAIDSQVKAPDDQPTIGLLLCKSQNRIVAELHAHFAPLLSPWERSGEGACLSAKLEQAIKKNLGGLGYGF